MAPEQFTVDAHFDQKVDIWSLGVILYELLLGKTPFKARTLKRLFKKIRESHIDYEADHWEDVSIEAQDFIEKLLVKESNDRIDAESLLKESWLHSQSLDCKIMGLRYPSSS